jgi:hypothetical protein
MADNILQTHDTSDGNNVESELRKLLRGLQEIPENQSGKFNGMKTTLGAGLFTLNGTETLISLEERSIIIPSYKLHAVLINEIPKAFPDVQAVSVINPYHLDGNYWWYIATSPNASLTSNGVFQYCSSNNHVFLINPFSHYHIVPNKTVRLDNGGRCQCFHIRQKKY